MKITIEVEVPDDPNGMKQLIDTINSLKGFKLVTTDRFPTRQQEMSFPHNMRDVDLKPKTSFETGEALEDPRMQDNGSPIAPPRGYKKLSTDEVQAIAQLLARGESSDDVALQFGCKRKTIYDLSIGKSYLYLTGFEPYVNRGEEVNDRGFLNRTPTGRCTKRGTAIMKQYAKLRTEGINRRKKGQRKAWAKKAKA